MSHIAGRDVAMAVFAALATQFTVAQDEPWFDATVATVARFQREDGAFPASFEAAGAASLEATARVLLAFAWSGAAVRDEGGSLPPVPRDAVTWLRGRQLASSGRIGDGLRFEHALATAALAEIGASTGQTALRAPVERAVAFLVAELEATVDSTDEELVAAALALRAASRFGVDAARSPARALAARLQSQAIEHENLLLAGAAIALVDVCGDELPEALLAVLRAGVAEKVPPVVDPDVALMVGLAARIAGLGGVGGRLATALRSGQRREGELAWTWPAPDGRDLLETARRLCAICVQAVSGTS